MSHGEKEFGYGSSPHMKTVAWSMLVMGISLAIIIVMWAWFGWMGPPFSDEVLRQQQEWLRGEYGLPPTEHITEEESQMPPSLRDLANNSS